MLGRSQIQHGITTIGAEEQVANNSTNLAAGKERAAQCGTNDTKLMHFDSVMTRSRE